MTDAPKPPLPADDSEFYFPVTAAPRSRVYGRRKGRPLHKRKARLVAELLPALQIEIPAQGGLNPATLFPQPPAQMWLEIGFGGGEHLAAQAGRHPTHGFIGCEPFLNGTASLLDHIDRQALTNIRVFPNDARRILDAMPTGSIDRCFVLFADPWPKARHADRRFIEPENIQRLARVLRAGAELRLATDDAQLAVWMREHMNAATDFAMAHDSTTPPVDWVPTRYEAKGIKAGRAPVYFVYRRV